MWQLETAATNASSGSTCAGFEQGTGTTEGDGEAGTVTPPSKLQVGSREYLTARKSGLVRFQLMIALCSDIQGSWAAAFIHLHVHLVASFQMNRFQQRRLEQNPLRIADSGYGLDHAVTLYFTPRKASRALMRKRVTGPRRSARRARESLFCQ